MPISPKLEFKEETLMAICLDLNLFSQMERSTRTKVANQTHSGILWTPPKDNLQRYTLQLVVKFSQMRIVLLCIYIWNSVTGPKMKAVRSRVAIPCVTKLTSQLTKKLLASMDTVLNIPLDLLVSFWRINSEKNIKFVFLSPTF